jgi:hypothetical protein
MACRYRRSRRVELRGNRSGSEVRRRVLVGDQAWVAGRASRCVRRSRPARVIWLAARNVEDLSGPGVAIAIVREDLEPAGEMELAEDRPHVRFDRVG